jgi:hypothetical protein
LRESLLNMEAYSVSRRKFPIRIMLVLAFSTISFRTRVIGGLKVQKACRDKRKRKATSIKSISWLTKMYLDL